MLNSYLNHIFRTYLEKERLLITMNNFTIMGTLDSVFPLEETSSGIKVINFIVSVEHSIKSNQTFDQFKVMAFGALAEGIASKIPVGSSILVKGHLQANNYCSDEKNDYLVELLADEVRFISK